MQNGKVNLKKNVKPSNKSFTKCKASLKTL